MLVPWCMHFFRLGESGSRGPQLPPSLAAAVAAAAAAFPWHRWALSAAHCSLCPCFQPVAAQGPSGQYHTQRQPAHTSSLGTPAWAAVRPHVAHL